MASTRIGLEVLERLREIDEVTYLRFASVYKDFTGVDDFEPREIGLRIERLHRDSLGGPPDKILRRPALQLARGERIIEAFDLYKHYDVDSMKNQYHRTTVTKMFDENVSVKKTEYESVQITVLDTDPKVASAIAESASGTSNAGRS